MFIPNFGILSNLTFFLLKSKTILFTKNYFGRGPLTPLPPHANHMPTLKFDKKFGIIYEPFPQTDMFDLNFEIFPFLWFGQKPFGSTQILRLKKSCVQRKLWV